MRKILLLVFAVIVLGLIIAYLKKPVADEGITLYGNVDVRQVDLGFRVSGRVEAMYFEEGDLVKPGDLLGKLEKRPYSDQANQEKANVNSVNQSLDYARQVFKRREELIGGGNVSKEDYEQTLTNVKVLEANAKLAEASLAYADTNLRDTEVFAPTEGTILTRIREPGTVVNAADPIYTLSVLSPIWIRAYVTEKQLGEIYPGMKAKIFTDNNKTYEGNIGFISPVAEFTPKTVETTELRTDLVYRIRVYTENKDKTLKQGMPVTVKLQP